MPVISNKKKEKTTINKARYLWVCYTIYTYFTHKSFVQM